MADLQDLLSPDNSPNLPQQPAKAKGISDVLFGDDPVEKKLDYAVDQGVATPPDKAARILRMQARTGLDSDFIERNLEDVENETKKADFDPVKYRQSSPVVAQWLSEHPNNVSAAYEDLTNLNLLERHWRDFTDNVKFSKDQISSGLINNKLYDIGWKAMMGTVTPEDRIKQAQLENQLQELGRDDHGVKSFLGQIPGKALGMVPLLAKTTYEAWPEIAGGLAVGSLLPGVGTLGGGGLGWKYGSAISNGKMMASLAYLEFEKIKDAEGIPLDRTTAVGAATVVGTLSAAVDLLPLGSLAKTLPGLRAFTADGMKQLLASQTARQVMTTYLKNIGEHSLKSGGAMAFQELVKNTASELLTMSSDGTLQKYNDGQISASDFLGRVFNQENLQKTADAFRTGVQAGAGTATVTGTFTIPRDLKRANEAMATSEAFKAIGDTSSQLKMNEKVPSASQEVISRLAKNGPIENVYAPIDSWDTYWQSKKADPAEVANHVTGDPEAYFQAKESGHDLPIRTEDYATKIAPTEHNKFFADELKSDPTSMNAREAKEFHQHLAEVEKQAVEENKPAQPIAQESASKIHEDVTQQLINGGMAPDIAKTNAQIPEAFFNTMSAAFKKEGIEIDPYDLYSPYRLKINRPELQGERGVPGGKEFNQSYELPKIEIDPDYFKDPVGKGDKELPRLLPQDLSLLGKEDKPVVIKESIAKKNQKHSDEINGQDNEILKSALYNATHIIQSKPESHPDNYSFVSKIPGTSSHVLLELKNTKDQYEVVNWHPIGERQFKTLVKRAEREGGQVLMTERANPQGVAGLSTLTPGSKDSITQSGTQIPGDDEGNKTYHQTPESTLAPTFYSKLQRTIEEKMPNSATPEQVNGILKDVKAEERKWSGIDELLKGKDKVSKQEVLDHLRANQLEIKEVTKGGGSEAEAEGEYYIEKEKGSFPYKVYDWAGNEKQSFKTRPEAEAFLDAQVQKLQPTKYDQYQLPGGENYKEILFTLPKEQDQNEVQRIAKEQYGKPFNELSEVQKKTVTGMYDGYANEPTTVFRSSHFDEPNILAHARISERTDSQGKKVLFIEELQSDWHQQGREKGYRTEVEPPKSLTPQEQKRLTELRELNNRGALETGAQDAEYAALAARAHGVDIRDAVPDAPFRKSWHEYVLKRLIRYAAENGFDKISWTTGDQQAERYDLSKQVDEIGYSKTDAGTTINVSKDGETVLKKKLLSDSELEATIGKEAAKKILDSKKDEGQLSGMDLKIGGSGMKGFYDKIIPDFLNKFGKKYDAKVGETEIGSTDTKEQYQVHEFEGDNGKPYFEIMDMQSHDVIDDGSVFHSEQEAQQRVDELNSQSEPVQLKVHALEITPKLRDAALTEGFSLFQGDKNDPIGRIQFGPNGVNIDLLKDANLSTFLHENGHFYLEVMGDIAERADAPEQIKKDYQTLLEFAGVKTRDELKNDHHEKIAQAFEEYLKEGKAPSQGLRAAFARIAAWMTEVYRRIKNSVELTPEVRAVFDRMLATGDEIEAQKREQNAEPLFQNPKEFGMSEKEAGKYREVLTAADDAAKENLRTKAMADVTREQNKSYQLERERTQHEVEAEVNEKPDQIARAVLGKGEFPDGAPIPEEWKGLKLSKKDIVDDYGEDALKALPKPHVYSKEGGIHPDDAASIFGFKSGKELLDSLIHSQEPKNLIQELTDQRMKATHGDILTDGTMPEEAIKSLHNEKRAELMRKELEYLVSNEFATFKKLVKRVAGKVPPLETVTSQAQEIISGKKTRDINPLVYERAEVRASKEAMNLLLKGDFQGAFEAKKKELLNHELVRAANAARDNIDKYVEYLTRFSDSDVRAKVAKGGEDYLNQIDKILDRYDLKKSATLTSIDQKKALVDFVRQQHEAGFDIDIPQDIIDEAKRQSYKDTPLKELQAVRDTVKNIEHLALLQNKLLANEKFEDFQAAKSAVIASIQAHHELKTEPLDFSQGFLKRLGEKKDGFLAHSTRPEFFFEYLDGNKPQGAAWQVLFKPFADSEKREAGFIRESSKALKDIFSAYTKNERAFWFLNKVHIPEVDAQFTKSNILAVALNWGNKYNRDALMRGYKWSESQVQAILAHMDQRDWQTVQKIWDHINSYWPEIEKLEKRINGVAPEKVLADPVQTPYGTFEGGYYPIVFDSKMSWRQSLLEERAQTQEIFGGQWARAQTRQGHAQERTDTGGKPISLSLSGLTNHLGSVIHDITHREAVIDAHRMINDKDVRETIMGAAGRAAYKELNPWLKAIAGDRQMQALNPVEEIFTRARQGATVVNLGWKVTTGLVHTQGYLTTTNELGAKYAALGLQRTLGNPTELGKTWDFISSRSEMMKNRAEHMDRDLRDKLKSLNVAGVQSGPMSVVDAYTADVQRSFFHHIAFMDLAGSMPAWMGGYMKAMDGELENVKAGDEKAAIDYADSVVRMTKAAAGVKDLAGIERGSPMFKLFTMFCSQQSLRLNQLQKAYRGQRLQSDIPKLVAAGTLLWWAPAVLESVLRGHLPNGNDDDDEKFKEWVLHNELKYPLESLVFGRDIVAALEKRDYQASPAFSAISEGVQALRGDYKGAKNLLTGEGPGMTRQDVKNNVMTVGYFAQLPTRQMWLTLEYLYDWMQGNEEPDNPVAGIYHSLVTGKQKK